MSSVTIHISLLLLATCVANAEIFLNAGFEGPLGLDNWSCKGCTGSRYGENKVEGDYSMLVSGRTADWAGPSQDLAWGATVRSGQSYAFGISVKLLDHGATSYQVKVNMKIQFDDGSDAYLSMSKIRMSAQDGWKKMYGDITVPAYDGKTVTKVRLYVVGFAATVRFLVDGASLRELRRETWRARADARIEQIRKRNVVLRVNTTENVDIEVVQTRSHFGFGSAVKASELEGNSRYRDFFFNNFEWAVLENALKWPQTESFMGVHSWPDNAISMLESRGVPVRGHCIFWAEPKRVPWWLKLFGWIENVEQTCWQRIDDVVGRYAGRLPHWDVNNEMLHASYFMDETGSPQIRYDMFRRAQQTDPNVKLFLNDYSVIAKDHKTQAYSDQISEFLSNGAPVGGVGVQGHHRSRPDPVLIQSRLDVLAAHGLPIWVTELDYEEPDEFEKADGYEDALRAAFSHPAVHGVMVWGFWDLCHWRPDAALVNGDDFKLNEAGRRWQQLVHTDWRTNLSLTDGLMTSAGREFNFRGFHGNYDVTVRSNGQTLATKSFYLSPEDRSLVVDVDLASFV